MATVNVEVNGRAYAVGCDDGQEAHVEALAKSYDAVVSQVAADVGQVGEVRLFLLGALLLADELSEAKSKAAEAQATLARAGGDAGAIERRAASALEAAARRIEALAERL